MGIPSRTLKRGAILLLAGLLVWRILVVGFSDYYAGQATAAATAEAAAAAAALSWRRTQPVALYRQGQALTAREPAAAETLLRGSVWADPTNALAFLALAELVAGTGRVPEAMRLAKIADDLGPMRTPALARAAAFWFKQGRPDLGIDRWSAMLQSNPAAAAHVFPSLLRLADNPETRHLLLPLLSEPPDWWDRFFAYAATTGSRLETASFLYQGRNRAGALPSAAEQRVYLDRLWKEGRWLDTYLVWLGGLDERAQTGLGHIYNGSFELPVTGIGFDWRISSVSGAQIETLETYGARGGRSLHVVFAGLRQRFHHVEQPRYLPPGRYLLRGRVRPQGVMPRQGLRWAVHCNSPKDKPLAATGTFSGKDDWQTFALELEVPEADCPVQVLRLEQEPQARGVGEAHGEIWFDDLAIQRRG